MLALAATAAASQSANESESSGEPKIYIEDVERFYEIYEASGGRPTAGQLQRDYLDAGSEGLHQFARIRNITGERIAQTLSQRPEIYANARRCMEVLPRVRERVRGALQTLKDLYPDARFPPVTIAVSRGKPVAAGSPVTGIQVGLEALCSTDWLHPNVEDRFVLVIVHEYVHVQQNPAITEKEQPTVLEAALVEGAAEFVTELLAGEISYSYLPRSVQGREKVIEASFVEDLHETDLSRWLFNSTPEKPGDLGYWVGYRIVKAYYRHAADKQQALREILEMSDANAFFGKSGWQPGIALK